MWSHPLIFLPFLFRADSLVLDGGLCCYFICGHQNQLYNLNWIYRETHYLYILYTHLDMFSNEHTFHLPKQTLQPLAAKNTRRPHPSDIPMFDGPQCWAKVITGTVKNHTINAQLEESAYNQRFHQGIFGMKTNSEQQSGRISISSKYLVKRRLEPLKAEPQEMWRFKHRSWRGMSGGIGNSREWWLGVDSSRARRYPYPETPDPSKVASNLGT